jgi:hypothetical protein
MKTLKNIIVLISFFASIAFPQESKGKITGRVIDEATQQPLTGAVVTVDGTGKGAATDLNGNYEIDGLSFGNFKLTASLIGYKPQTQMDIFVNSAKPSVVDFSLAQSAIELQGITVTSSLFQKDPNQLNSIATFNYEEIRRSPGGFEDVIRALSVLPGVAQADAGRNDLIVRGGAPSENLYVLDGIVVPNINHFGTQGATGGPLSYIDLNYVNETSFSTGGFSVMYGDKLSSVLTIDLRNGRQDKIGGKAIISASQFGLNIEGPISRNTDFLFSARRSYLDLIFKAAGASFIPEYYDVLNKVTHKIDGNNTLSFLLVAAFDRVKYINNTSDQKYDNSTVLGSNQMNYTTGLSFKHLFNNGFYNLTLSRNFNDYDTSQKDSLLNPLFLNKSKEGENSFKGDLVYKLSKNSELNIGGQFKYIKFNADIYFPKFITSFRDTLNVNTLNSSENFYKAGFYSQYAFILFNRLRVNAGVRTDYFNAIENKFTFSPRASFSYALTEITNLNFSTGIYHQTPSYIWLLANPINRNLKSIRTDQYILGIDHLLREDMQVRIEGFFKNYRDYPASIIRNYLVLANTGAGFAGSDDNFAAFGLDPLVSKGTGTVNGFELLLQKKSSGTPYYGTLSLTYSESFFKALDGVKRIGSYDQRWILSLSGGYMFDEKWEASMKFRFSTGKPGTPYNYDGTQDVSRYNSVRLDPNHSLDIRIDRRFNFNLWSLIAYVDIQNIYNRKNVSLITWNRRKQEPEKQQSFGILPSIGIIAEI